MRSLSTQVPARALEGDARQALRSVLRAWLPLSEAVLGMAVEHMPSPQDAAPNRLPKLMAIKPGVIEFKLVVWYLLYHAHSDGAQPIYGRMHVTDDKGVARRAMTYFNLPWHLHRRPGAFGGSSRGCSGSAGAHRVWSAGFFLGPRCAASHLRLQNDLRACIAAAQVHAPIL